MATELGMELGMELGRYHRMIGGIYLAAASEHIYFFRPTDRPTHFFKVKMTGTEHFFDFSRTA